MTPNDSPEKNLRDMVEEAVEDLPKKYREKKSRNGKNSYLMMDIHDKNDCKSTIDRIGLLLSCGIFKQDNSDHVLMPSAFIELMICLKDLLEKAKKYAKRVSFTDDIIVSETVSDVHDLVTAIRDGCCHIDSYRKYLGRPQYRASFLVMYCKGERGGRSRVLSQLWKKCSRSF